MKAQRGNIYFYLAGAIALIVALAGLVKVWGNYTSGLVKEGHDAGVAETKAAYTARDNAQLQTDLAAQRAAEVRAAQAEADAAKAQTLASSNYAKGVSDGKAKTAVLVAAARAGSLRLLDPGNQAGTGAPCGATTGSAAVAAGAPGGDGAAEGKVPAAPGGLLSAEASAFLLSLTGEADDAARQLAACQVILASDRKLCNGP